MPGVREDIFDEETSLACLAEIEAIEEFCKALRHHLERKHAAGIGADAKSIQTRVLMLVEYSAEMLAIERWRNQQIQLEDQQYPDKVRLPRSIVCCESCGMLVTRQTLERTNPAERRCDCGGRSWAKYIDVDRAKRLGLDEPCRRCTCGHAVPWTSLTHLLQPCALCGFEDWEDR
jgi:hypothetical protein